MTEKHVYMVMDCTDYKIFYFNVFTGLTQWHDSENGPSNSWRNSCSRYDPLTKTRQIVDRQTIKKS